MLSNTCDARRICRLFRLYNVYSCYQNGKRIKIQGYYTYDSIYLITSAKHISNVEGYTMYYKEGYKVRIIYFYDIREVLL